MLKEPTIALSWAVPFHTFLLLIYISSIVCYLHYIIQNFIDNNLFIAESCFPQKIDFSF